MTPCGVSYSLARRAVPRRPSPTRTPVRSWTFRSLGVSLIWGFPPNRDTPHNSKNPCSRSPPNRGTPSLEKPTMQAPDSETLSIYIYLSLSISIYIYIYIYMYVCILAKGSQQKPYILRCRYLGPFGLLPRPEHLGASQPHQRQVYPDTLKPKP